jgi:uncharacterized protein HemY
MAKRRGDETGTVLIDSPVEILRRRARRLARQGELRKAALALRELTALCDDAATWVMLGDMLRRARREDEAVQALREGLWRHRQAGSDLRARSVARLILALEPGDTKLMRFASCSRAA